MVRRTAPFLVGLAACGYIATDRHDGSGTGRDGGVEAPADAGRADSPGPLTPEEEAVAQIRAALCEEAIRCSPRHNGELDQVYCHSGYEDSFRQSLRAHQIGRAAYDPALARACLEEIAREPCDSIDGPGRPSCDSVFRGIVGEGGVCATDVMVSETECERGLLCHFDLECPARCAPLPGEGEPCPELTCSDPDRLLCWDGTCVRRQTLGEPCADAGDKCAGGLSCSGWVCGPGLPDGSDCTEGVCNDRSVCMPGPAGSWVCEPLIARRSLGESCLANSYIELCEPPLVCAGAFGRTFGTCVIGAPVGEPCDDGTSCAAGSVCGDDDRCWARVRPGEHCEGRWQCPWMYDCIDGGCAPIGTLGESCAYLGTPCIEGVCGAGWRCLDEGSSEGELCLAGCRSGLECRRVADSRVCLPACE